MTFETELRDQLHAGVDHTEVDLDQLLLGGVAYGNKLVRRRRLFRIVAGAATVAVLGGGLAYAGSLNADVAPAGQQQTKPITPQAAGQILLESLPDAKKAKNFSGRENSTSTERLATSLYYTDGGSTALVEIRLLTERFTPVCVKGADQFCQVTTLADGSRLELVENQSSGSSGNYKHLQANLYRKDGLVIALLAENREQYNPNTSPTRAPLTLAQLKAVVLSPRWQQQLDPAFVEGAAGLFTPRPNDPPSVPTTPGATK